MTIRHLITLFCLRVIRLVNDHKDDALAARLHEVAGSYQSSPCDGWLPPDDWSCWEEKAEAERIVLERNPLADVWAGQVAFYVKRWNNAVSAARKRMDTN